MSRMVSMIRSGIRTTTSAVRNSSAVKASLILTVCVNMICGPVVASSTLPFRFTHTERAHKANAAVPAEAGPSVIPEAKKRELIEQKNLGHLPLSFEANTGQTDARVKFLSRGSSYGLYLTSDEAVMVFNSQRQPSNKTNNAHSAKRREVMRMKLISAVANANLIGLDPLPGKTNYFFGNDPAKWRTDISNYRKVKYEQIYPGIDLVYYGNSDGQLEYDFLVAPNADPGNIKLKFDGIARLKLDKNGDLLLTNKTGTLRHQKPLIYQELNGIRTSVDGGYVLGSNGEVSFRLGNYDKTRPLIIDPVIVYSTYLGGTDLDEGFSIALDSSGNIYLAGITDSTDFPLENPFQSINKGGNGPVGYYELYATKLDPTGQSIIYSTYLGGTGIDRGGFIAVDNDGNLHITGSTSSTDFPMANAYQSTYGGGASDAFLTKLSPTGNFLIYSTYFGGNGPNWLPGNYSELGNAISFDNVGNAYLAGETDSFGFPVVQPLKATKGGTSTVSDAFLLKISTAGSLLFSTYLGGNNDNDTAMSMTTDTAGNIYLSGSTMSTDFPVLNAPSFLSQNASRSNAFVMKLPVDLSSITYSTLIGGKGHEAAGAIAVDTSQNIYLGGSTYSHDFPVMNPFQPINPTPDVEVNADPTGWITKLQSDFSLIQYSTYLGGSDYSDVNTIALDPSNNLWVYGTTTSTDYPVVDAIYPANRGYQDETLSKFSLDGSTLIFSTYLGGNNYDRPGRMVLNSDGEIYVSGNTGSSNFPLLNPYQPAYGGGASDAFIIKIAPQNSLLTISGTVSDGYGAGMAGVTINITGSVSKSGVTLPNGRYLFSVAPGGNYTVQATKAPLTFLPASQTFNSLSNHQVANFAVANRTLSGRVIDIDGIGVSGVNVALTGHYSRTVQTDINGLYSIITPSGGSYTLTPSKTDLLANSVFTPTTRSVTNLNADTGGLDFTSSITYAESFLPIADAHVEDGVTANQNFGTLNSMRLQTKNGSKRDIFFKFDVSGVSRKVINAKLRFYASTSFGSVTTAAYEVGSSNWVESGPQGITWNTAPPHPNAIAGATATLLASTTYDIDVTSYMLNEIAVGRSVFSLALHNPSNSASAYASVNSRESGGNFQPELRIITGDNNRPPSVSLTPPNGNPFTAPANIPLQATASDSDGSISKVDFYAGSQLIGTATASPYTITWSNAAAGNYLLKAIATDNNGAMSSSDPVNVVVNVVNTPPVATLSTPLNGTTFPAGTNISLAATAADFDGLVSKVEFFAGSTLVGTSTTPVNGLYTATWSNANSGAYSLFARATDNLNGVGNSAAASINVVARTGLPPTADAYVRDGSSAPANFGTATTLQTQSSATAGNNRETYLKFDLTTVSSISSAKVRLFGALSDTTSSNVPAAIFSVASTTWVESGSGSVTWNTKPVSGATGLASSTITDNVSRWYEWDVTAYLQAEKTAGRSIVSLVIKNSAQSSAFASFNSREAATNQPQLVLLSTQPRNALLVVGSTTLNTGENAAKTRLQNLGFTVTVKAAGSNQNGAIKTSDADGKALVVISSTVTPANVTNKFRNVAVPVLLWEFDLLDDMGMTGLVSGTDFGTTTNQSSLVITTPAHAMAAGLSGSPVVLTPASTSTFTWGKPNTNAVKVASLAGDATKFVIFGYDARVAMPGLEAPARRVSLFLSDTTAASLNTDGGALFDAAVRWATELITAPIIYTLTPATGPAGTNVTIDGVNFGAVQGTSTLSFNGVTASPSSWNDRSIVAPVPLYSSTGPVVVTVSGVASNAMTFVVAETDVDGDGLADWWEVQYFGNLNQTATGDPDGDGITNLQEYQQGRNPTKSAVPDANGAVDLKVYTPLRPPTP
jgi:hypothetical protein